MLVKEAILWVLKSRYFCCKCDMKLKDVLSRQLQFKIKKPTIKYEYLLNW